MNDFRVECGKWRNAKVLIAGYNCKEVKVKGEKWNVVNVK